MGDLKLSRRQSLKIIFELRKMWFPVFGPEVAFQNYHFYKKLQKLLNWKNTLESTKVK